MEGKHDAVGTSEEEDEFLVSGGEDERHRPIISGEPHDIEAYAALYTGRTRIMRLLFIDGNCGDPSMELEAFRMAYEEIKNGQNTQLFREVVEKIGGRLGPNYGPDNPWADAVDRQADLRKKKLENGINDYKSSLIKESVRMGYNDFGDFYYEHGLLVEAFKNYILMRGYCSTPMHIIHMCLKAILVSIEMGQFARVSNYASKAEAHQDCLDLVITAKLRCAAGLAHLEGKNYKTAARKFLETGPEIGNYTEVIAAQDIATYGGLCALASFDLAELKSKVIDNSNFRNFLELPQCFLSGIFEKSRANLLLDIHLHDHVGTLYEQIRNRALIQYTLPYVSIDLHVMANAFETSVTCLEKELEALIATDQIQALIYSHGKILYAQRADHRNDTFQRVLQAANELNRELKAMLLRANLMKHNDNL